MNDWKQQMDQARGLAEIDLVLRNALLVNVLSGEIHPTEIGIQDGRFVGIGTFPLAREELDLKGQYVVPGLIDGHVHIESSHLCPEEFCSLLLLHGVTTAVVDPHEIANVLGNEGIRYIIKHLEGLPFNAFVALPSCVPATEFETSGARLTAQDLQEWIEYPQVIGLGEVMDYSGVLAGKPDLIAKLDLPVRIKDGHAPGISAQDLNAYYLAGMHTDHECSTPDEVRERLRRGFHVLLREGSAAKNLLELLPAVTPQNSGQCLFVTDDRHTIDLLQEGSIDHLIRIAIHAGIPPVQALQMGTINAARALGLEGLGAIAPGYQADFLILKDFEHFEIEKVFWRGELQSYSGVRKSLRIPSSEPIINTIRLNDWSMIKLQVNVPVAADTQGKSENGDLNRNTKDGGRKDLSGKAPRRLGQAYGNVSKEDVVSPHLRRKVRVIGVQEHSLITRCEFRYLPVSEGRLEADPEQGIAKIAVLERHQNTGRVGLGFVEGLGLIKGAIASTVAHDSHNLAVVGMNDRDMDIAIRACAERGGGLALACDGRLLESLSLPIAGLMTEENAVDVAHTLNELHGFARQLGIAAGVDPFMTLAFLSLPVIPELKITDLGLVNVQEQRIVPLLFDE